MGPSDSERIATSSRPTHHPHSHPFNMTMFLARKSLSQVMVRSIPRASVLPSTFIPSSRFISSSSILRSDAPPVIQGEGAKAGQVATDEQQATGLERFELLGKLSGKDVFDMEPLEMTRLGTTKDPIVIDSLVSRGGRKSTLR